MTTDTGAGGVRRPTRAELLELEDAAADRLAVQLDRFPAAPQPGRMDSVQAARVANAFIAEARERWGVSGADLLDGAARLLGRLEASDGGDV